MLVKMKQWRMRKDTRSLLSEIIHFTEDIYTTYNQRVTVRQIYYHLFSKGMIKLSLKDYHKIVTIITAARKRGYLPFEWIEDRSRRPFWHNLFDSIEEFIAYVIGQYRRNTWSNQKKYIIILVEKEALAPMINDIAKEYNVFVFPTKGFSSWSMFVQDIMSATNTFGQSKEFVVLVLSDLDPSGKKIKEDYCNKFAFMTKEFGFPEPHIEKIAINEEQVKEFNIPSMTKVYNGIEQKIWELDALDPKTLRSVVEKSIIKHIDLEQLAIDIEIEKSEKDALTQS